MRISDVYRPGMLTCATGEPLPDVARKMAAEQVGALAVVDGNRVIGVITERDLTRALASEPDPRSATAAAYVTHRLEVAKLDDDSREVAGRMLDAGVRHLPVVGDHVVVGMVSVRDLLAVETWA